MSGLGFDTLNNDVFQTQLKTKYKSMIFMGYFKEKRLCEDINCYRDVVVVDKKEIEFAKSLETLALDIKSQLREPLFVGVTKDEKECFSIWTELGDSAIPFGKYWFQIKTIKFRFNEIQIKLKKLRSIENEETETFEEKFRTATNQKSENSNDELWKTLFEFWKKEIVSAVAWFSAVTINRHTITETLRFVSLLFVSLIAGSSQIIKYVGIFTIKLIERTTWLAHVLTPVALGLFDLVSKIIGGFYLLIAMVWKDSFGARRPVPANAIGPGPPRRRQEAIRYNNF